VRRDRALRDVSAQGVLETAAATAPWRNEDPTCTAHRERQSGPSPHRGGDRWADPVEGPPPHRWRYPRTVLVSRRTSINGLDRLPFVSGSVDDEDDYYRVLGVDPLADVLAIHRAYRVQARRFHPDLIGDDARMKVINVAWAVLRDASRRASYDADRAPAAPPIEAPAPSMHAATDPGLPPGKPSGRVVDYGRYKGWSLGEIARVDPDYLEWLRKAPGYRWLSADVDAALASIRVGVSRRRS
jgi:DnaJ domain